MKYYYYYTTITQLDNPNSTVIYNHGVCDYHPLKIIIENNNQLVKLRKVLVYSEEITKEQHDEFIRSIIY